MKNFKDRRFLMENPDLLVIDVRYVMGASQEGLKEYQDAHYKNAAYLHLDHDLAGPVRLHGGRHPLPDQKRFQEKLRSIGLRKNQGVMIYDHGDNGPAGRLWWMLKYYGLASVYVLEGGFSVLLPEDLTDKPSAFLKGDVELHPDGSMMASYEEIMEYANRGGDGQRILLDARSTERYQGFEEPIDPKAGHIPHAENVPYRSHFLEDNTLKPLEEIRRSFQSVEGISDVINHCGSGVTACTNIMLLEELSLSSRLYVGSFSDYVSHPENPVVGA